MTDHAGGDAAETLRRFWEIQDGGDYSRLSELFSDDAVLVDPIFGTFHGAEAIAGFKQMIKRIQNQRARAGARAGFCRRPREANANKFDAF